LNFGGIIAATDWLGVSSENQPQKLAGYGLQLPGASSLLLNQTDNGSVY
jgi:hypothetical protein